MSTNRKLISTALAAAAALTFATAPITSALAQGATGDVQCYGVNACKGQGSCKSATNACKGKNSCKGKGMQMMSEADCTKAGGTTSQS